MTNSERRLSRVRAAVRPPGEARPDWQLACAVGRRLAAEVAPSKASLFSYRSAAEIFAEHARLTAGRDLDYSALSHALLDAAGPQQWPFAPLVAPRPRLYADGVFPTPDGRARFMDIGYMPVAERPSARRPLRLTTGRLRDQWHTMNRTGLVPKLARHVEEPYIHLHPEDMDRLGIAGGQLVEVQSERGSLVAPAQADPALKPGHAYMPMHWGSAYMAGDGVNALGNDVLDPLSHQPELKHSAVSVRPLACSWQTAAWIRGAIPELRRRLAPWLRVFPYAVLVPSAIGGESVRLRAAALEAPGPAVLERLAADLELQQPDMAFDDPARGILRRLRRGDDRLQAFLLAGDLRAQAALLAWAEDGKAPDDPGRMLMGRMRAAIRAPIVCACHGVAEDAIVQAIRAGQSLEDLRLKLKCGTSCGSCVPQLKRMLREHGAGEIAA